MANYYGVTRTNYFRVTDEDAYQKLFANLSGEDTIDDFTEVKDGITYHGFGSYSSITYSAETIDDEDDDRYMLSMDRFFEELQKILPDNEAFILMESGYEKLRYVIGWSTIVTKNAIKTVDMISEAVKTARELLDDPNYTTQCEY